MTSTTASNAGGVAARQGFKYQDHVAAHWVLAMIADPRLTRVECETADDILLVWKEDSKYFREYVQVKTTESDKKWSQTEMLQRTNIKNPTSLVEKSLLCDIASDEALFRIISRREVNKALASLKLPRSSGSRTADAAAIGKKLAKKWQTKSENGNDLAVWTNRVVWQVTGEISGLKANSKQYLQSLAEERGTNPTYSHSEAIYTELLGMVDDAASASKITDPEKKIITRERVLGWWAKQLAETEAARQKTAKPYAAFGEHFFTTLHTLNEAGIRRALTSYDARFEKAKWRSLQLADHLVDWLPELALKASDLVSIQHLKLRKKTREAVRSIKQRQDLTADVLLAETLLHAIVRQYLGSEPIACKLFYQSSTGLKSFGSAHIVHTDKTDELWLGRAAVATADSYKDVVGTIVTQLEHVLDADFLKEEREIILTLREKQHLLPTTLESAFAANAPIDDLIRAICIPILIGYDSSVLSGGYADDYQSRLTVEVLQAYGDLKPQVPQALKAVNVHIFLIPIECVKSLSDMFSQLMQSAATHGV